MGSNYFMYGEKEIEHLCSKDPKLGWAIDQIGFIQREVESDFFLSLVRHIVGQQISRQAQISVMNRVINRVGVVSVETILKLSVEELQKAGMTFKKAQYIMDLAQAIDDNTLKPQQLQSLSDKEIIATLIKYKGVGRWTAEMLLLFNFQRPDIVSYTDLAILRGMRMLYQKEKINKKEFDEIVSFYTPYGSIASLYLWAIARGAIESLVDPTTLK